MVCKDEVVDWFHKLNGAGRLDAMCTLLDVCLPFEIRFLGTFMENLGRRDFHELRDADHRANSFLHPSRSGVSDKMALCNALLETPQQLSSPSNVSGHPPAYTGPPQQNHVNTPDSSTPACRPNSVQISDKVRSSGSGTTPQSQQPNAVGEVPFMGGRQSGALEGSTETGNKVTSMNIPVVNSNEKDEKGDKPILVDDLLRRRLVLYMSLLTATNRECANAYYKVLSEVQPLLEQAGWLEMMEENILEEMALLYTIAGNHPAFTFEQRNAMGEVGNKFRAQQAKMEAPKVFTQTTQSFVATAVQGFDPKYGHYYIHCFPHPVQAMQWPSPNGSGNLVGGTNGTVEDGSRLQSPVTFTIPPYHPFPAMFMPAHHPQSQTPIHHTQIQVPHQFSPNIPVQTSVSPQAPIGMSAQPHPSQMVGHSFQQQNPRVQQGGHNNVHIQAPSHVQHAYSPTMNGPVQNILPVPSAIHTQMPPHVGLTTVVPTISSTVIPQFGSKTQSVSQLSPQLSSTMLPRNSLSVGNNMSTGSSFPSQSNSIDGNESEECYFDSTESSPYQSPPQSLTPSRSQSPTPVNQGAHVITNQNQSLINVQPQNQSLVNVQPVISHLNISQQEIMMSGSKSLPPTSSTAYSSLSQQQQRSVCSSATSISPPPRSQKTCSSQKLSQNMQTQARILPKNAQDIEVSLASLNNVNVPYSSGVPASNPPPSVNILAKAPSNCVSANNLNGMKPSVTDRRSIKQALMSNSNINSCSPATSTSSSVVASAHQQQQQTSTSQLSAMNSSATATSSNSISSNFPPHPISVNSSSSSLPRESSRRPPNRRSASVVHHNVSSNNPGGHHGTSNNPVVHHNTSPNNPAVHHTPTTNNPVVVHHNNPLSSTSNHFNVHSQPIKNNGLAASTNHSLPQYNFTVPFSIPQFQPNPSTINPPTNKGPAISSHGTPTNNPIPTNKQAPIQTMANQNGSKMISSHDLASFTGHPTTSQSSNSHNHNGIKLLNNDCSIASSNTFTVPSGLTIINAVPPSLPLSSAPLPSQTSRNRVLLEVGGGQEVVNRLDGTQFFSPLDEVVEANSRPKMSCYNCGAQTHFGPDCKENTMEEMTKHPYRINFLPENPSSSSSPETKDSE